MQSEPGKPPKAGDFQLKSGALVKVIVAIVTAIIVSLILCLLLIILWMFTSDYLTGVDLVRNYSSTILSYFLYILVDVVLFAVAVGFSSQKDLKKALSEVLGLKIDRAAVKYLIVGIAIGTGIVVLLHLVFLVIGLATINTRDLGNLWSWAQMVAPLMILSFGMYILNTIGYETFFRGYVQRSLTADFQAFLAIGIGSALFGAFILFPNILSLPFLIMLIIGMISGYLYHLTRSLFVSFGFMFSYSYISDVLGNMGFVFFPPKAGGTLVIGRLSANMGTEGLLIQVILYGALLGVIYVYYIMDKQQKGSAIKAVTEALDRLTGGN